MTRQTLHLAAFAVVAGLAVPTLAQWTGDSARLDRIDALHRVRPAPRRQVRRARRPAAAVAAVPAAASRSRRRIRRPRGPATWERRPDHLSSGKGGGRRSASPSAPPPGGVAMAIAPPVNASAERRTGARAMTCSVLIEPDQYAVPRRQPHHRIRVAASAVTTGGGGGDFVGSPFWGPWGSWYPWYTAGWCGVGFYGYSPWYYGATCWGWGRYGRVVRPVRLLLGFVLLGRADELRRSRGHASQLRQGRAQDGQVRILASVKTANVYIDDALAGTVDEFDGLNDHLEIDTGRHTISLMADGYRPPRRTSSSKAVRRRRCGLR